MSSCHVNAVSRSVNGVTAPQLDGKVRGMRGSALVITLEKPTQGCGANPVVAELGSDRGRGKLALLSITAQPLLLNAPTPTLCYGCMHPAPMPGFPLPASRRDT
jgi:hypothetical protein